MFIILVQLINKSLIILTLFLSSCVYYNTFYNAQNSFNQAIKIIDNESSKNYQDNFKISNTAKKLLNESISSSNLVIKDFPESKYVDDALYYMGRSYYTLGEIYKSEKYFKLLIDNHINSEFYDETRIWLQYSKLKLNLKDSIFFEIQKIESDLKSKKNIDDKIYYLLYNLKGEFYIIENNFDDAFIEYEKSLNFIKNRSQKIMMYSKLSSIYEKANDYNKAISYLEKIQSISNDKDIKIESFRKWLEIMKKRNLYSQIISNIQEKIITSDFESPKIQDELNIELAIAFMKVNSFNESKIFFNKIIESTNQKLIKAQAYYWLGYISLFTEFELDLAIEYFNLVSETMRSSKFTKQSKDLIKDIDSYKSIKDEYNFLINDDTNQIILEQKEQENLVPNPNSMNVYVTKDSLLFIIAEKLYFDFNQKELSIEKHAELLNLYPSSKYASRSNIIIKQLSSFNNQVFSNKTDSITILRDSAWTLFIDDPLSFDNKGLVLLKSIANDYKDCHSYFSLGLIYENHFYNPELALENYLTSFKLCDDIEIKKDLKNKLLLFEKDINNNLDLYNKKINFFKAKQIIYNEMNLDSASYYLKLNVNNKKISNKIELDSKVFTELVDLYKNNLDLYQEYINSDSLTSKNNYFNKDSILYDLALVSNIIFDNKELGNNYYLNLSDSSQYYLNYKNFIENGIISKNNLNSSAQLINYYDSLKNEFEYILNDSLINGIKINNIYQLLEMFNDSLIHDEIMYDIERKSENNQNNFPNINNSLVPNINKN